MKRKSNKKLTIALLALLGVVSAGGTFAYWQGEVKAPEDEVNSNTVTIGKAAEVKTAITTDTATYEGEPLVPVGRDVTGVSVSSAEFEFSVTWKISPAYVGDVTATTGKLTVAAPNTGMLFKNVGEETAAVDLDKAGLFTVEITIGDGLEGSDIITLGNDIPVVVIVKLTFTTEPANKTAYDAIVENGVTLPVTFSIAAINSAE